jgi:hypothetical protein
VTASKWLDIAATQPAPDYAYYSGGIVIIGGTGGQTDTGDTGNGSSNGGDGSSNSGDTFVPAGAPKNPKPGTTYSSPYSGKTYIYDGSSWYILLPESSVKGSPPHNPPANTTYTFNTITYTFQYNSWTVPYTGINNTKDIEYVQNKCLGYKRMLDLQKQERKEVAAFVTTDGQVFILPIGSNNTEIRSETSTKYFDNNGNVVFVVKQNASTGVWELRTFDYSLDPNFGTETFYQLAAHVHTHPSNGNENIASDLDMNFDPNYPGLSKYIVNNHDLVPYDSSGSKRVHSRSAYHLLRLLVTNCHLPLLAATRRLSIA